MATKSWMYAQMEAVQYEMRQRKDMVWLFELTAPVASYPGLPVINLEKEFGRIRVNNTGIDEMWYAAAVLGCGLAGVPAIAYIPYQGNTMCFEIVAEHVAKLRHMSGGQASMPIVLILEESGQTPGFAGQHSDYEIDSYYMHTAGVKTVVPSTPRDAKGLLVAAIRDPDPVIYINPAGLRTLAEDVPDEQFEVPIGKAAVRTSGSDITIVGNGPSMQEVMAATERLKKDGVGVEAIDLRTLKPMDTETLVTSVRKTRRLLTVDQSYYTLCPGAEVVASVAAEVTPAKFKRIAFPDAPPPASPEMFLWARPNADNVYAAAKKLLA